MRNRPHHLADEVKSLGLDLSHYGEPFPESPHLITPTVDLSVTGEELAEATAMELWFEWQQFNGGLDRSALPEFIALFKALLRYVLAARIAQVNGERGSRVPVHFPAAWNVIIGQIGEVAVPEFGVVIRPRSSVSVEEAWRQFEALPRAEEFKMFLATLYSLGYWVVDRLPAHRDGSLGVMTLLVIGERVYGGAIHYLKGVTLEEALIRHFFQGLGVEAFAPPGARVVYPVTAAEARYLTRTIRYVKRPSRSNE